MGRFASTTATYEAARPPYGAAFFDRVARRLGLRGTGRLLDLGTGPGLLARGFMPFVSEAVGIDPEPDMLALARAASGRLREQGRPAPRFLPGRTEDLPTEIGKFDLVTIGRALHWMDAAATRAALDRVLVEAGAVLICRAGPTRDGRNPWLEPYDEERRRWGEDAGSVGRNRDLDAVFAGTRFKRRESIVVEKDHKVSVDTLADRVLSMSSTSPDRLGTRMPAMRSAILSVLMPHARNGIVAECVEARADIFRSG